MKEEVITYLEDEPRFRERKNKNRGIANILKRKYPALRELSIEMLVDAIGNAHSMDRAWRQALEKNPKLRGSDYGKKDELEENYQRELGYNV